MNSVGMLRTRRNPGLVAKTVAYICDHNNIQFFYFTLEDVDIKREKINGKSLRNGSWVNKEFDYPTIIDNEPMNKLNNEIYTILKQKSIFTTKPIGSKSKVFNLLYKNQEDFKDILIPYKIVKDKQDVLTLIKNWKTVLLKPSISNQGRNIFAIERVEKGFNFIDDNKKTFVFEENFEQEIYNIVLSKEYICQPFIISKTKEGNPFDVRLHVRKNSKGEWSKVKIYPRIGLGKNITANISQGGATSLIVPFLKDQYKNNWKEIKKKIDTLCLNFPNKFEKMYSYKFDALGIDLGIDLNGKLWLFEVNTYPGQQFFKAESSEMRVEYYKYLLKNGE